MTKQKKPLIINRPDLMSMRQKYANNTLKLLFVLSGIYLIVPIITFIIWYLAFVFFQQHILLLEGYKEYKTMTSVWYLIIIAAFSLMFILWSLGNLYFKRRKSKSIHNTDLSIEASSDYYQVPLESVKQFRKQKVMQVSFDDKGNINHIE
ncbi:poly-beta-1,6-N-acetyl-D-glucosamine biosynthesis protein PgaD [sulfur-oxidizing endosymbiont of Gigantopelta aegis]|uniref:poly-beta-1,6-N-acetyl-D-glucosamine biosynthesis protein PgaD n=1 Tax=sulfur-oxidizing endosymbiont of Gigantopelta aegis TaxID=2794934 RepID=UPI0018DCD418|nr:poly-beta-1,6-N-acetyl-D-glucosamine biosynthesis protein PgaD [sulfur-oxidizing endosymbiont of Gigantopelta aegis]